MLIATCHRNNGIKIATGLSELKEYEKKTTENNLEMYVYIISCLILKIKIRRVRKQYKGYTFTEL